MRIVAATNMNKTSSRSHAVFTMYYKEKCKKDGKKQIIDAKINIVDLAGSERQESTGATGDRLKEGSNINKSLTYLGVVIQKLGEKSKGGSFSEDFVPYRNSQLTHLLSESLGGNSKTIMIAALSPASINYDETLSTLRFAQNVSNVKTKTKANINEEAEVTQKMKDEIAEMKKKIESMKNAKHTVKQDEDEEEVFGDDQNDEQLKELEEIMRSQMSKLHDIKKSSEELHKEREEVDKRRQDALSNAGLVSSTLSIIQDANAINLINIWNDPSISNCLIYFMDKGKNTVGENNQNKIVLKGLGIAEY